MPQRKDPLVKLCHPSLCLYRKDEYLWELQKILETVNSLIKWEDGEGAYV